MPLNAGQREVVSSLARFRVVIAGRRWGKTHLAIRELARSARIPRSRSFYVAPTYRQAKQIVWDPLKYRLQDLGWTDRVNETDLTITLINGSRISLRGADNPDSLRGVGLDFVVIDEFAMVDQKAWTEVLRPTLSDRGGAALFISTPMGASNWAYDLFQRGQDTSEADWSSFHYTTIQGGNVTADEVESARRDLDARTFRQEYEATWEQYANRIFYAFDRAENVRPYQGSDPAVVYIGMDFNIDPMSAVVFHRDGELLHAIDEIEMYSSNTQEIVEEIHSRFPGKRIWVYPDPASRQRKTSAGGVTDLTILQNAGFVVKAPNSHNPVRDGINAVNSRLCNTLGQRNFVVDPRCRRLIECLEKHTYKEGTTQPDKDSGFDHMADAMRYAIDYMFPIRPATAPAPAQRWGHAVRTRSHSTHKTF
ncbi:phage_term_2, phage terminase, large subunit, PBSX family [uncultured Caudovirales phage]|uniref:Phage_term_2, phage terminase, large subunit, PBSX family n=1 Tax=uncultured Caudovirales phage TaxID=2100421 RepID=A0A6J7WMZ4_9CAUD|nr:phage_term_2, phage terminase, large subunit, PBSX family [uncultured Caudovirales phage]CAB5219127.1 phage_term_2, phage terminase, large subunit, PBSX family [uncultured Caudovirales phage]